MELEQRAEYKPAETVADQMHGRARNPGQKFVQLRGVRAQVLAHARIGEAEGLKAGMPQTPRQQP
ncbi:MAG: hypothetical protein H6R46_1311 [Proteobacteria bacterium]|nr:hypothetical protein [Pseudomonadota bacterium]